jgi:hypothetical protein
VELKVNDQNYGGKTSSNCIFKWPDVSLKKGTNTIEAIAGRDGKTYIDRCEWRLIEEHKQAGEPNN